MEEGVIKFDLRYEAAELPDSISLEGLTAWRDRLHAYALIGQDPARYAGYGFGNVSQRIDRQSRPCGKRAFVISGTQTGHLATLDRNHYTLVESYDVRHNRVTARGPVKPSSESLTHGIIYDMDDSFMVVLHAHSPDIWQRAGTLGIPETAADVEYGTPAMADEVARLFSETDVRKHRIFSMAGHLDGIVSFGESAAAAGEVMLQALQKSRHP